MIWEGERTLGTHSPRDTLKRASSCSLFCSLMTASFLMNFTSLKLMVRENRISVRQTDLAVELQKKESKWRKGINAMRCLFCAFFLLLRALFSLFFLHQNLHKMCSWMKGFTSFILLVVHPDSWGETCKWLWLWCCWGIERRNACEFSCCLLFLWMC